MAATSPGKCNFAIRDVNEEEGRAGWPAGWLVPSDSSNRCEQNAAPSSIQLHLT